MTIDRFCLGLDLGEFVATASVTEAAVRDALARPLTPAMALEAREVARLRIILSRASALRKRGAELLTACRASGLGVDVLEQALDFIEQGSRDLFVRLAHLQLSATEGETPERYQAIAVRLRQMRLDAGLTMEELGKRIGATKNIVNHVENGRRTTTLDIITRWSLACGYRLELHMIPMEPPSPKEAA